MFKKCRSLVITDLENTLVLLPIPRIRFNNLPGLNRQFLYLHMGDNLQVRKSAKTDEIDEQKILGFFPNSDDTYMCTYILSSWENETRLNKYFPCPKTKERAKACSSNGCEANALGKLAHDRDTFL